MMVPHSAKSAAAMIALSGEELLMDERGELGPIDPQMIVPRDEQLVASPAQAIQDQFEKAQKDVEENPQRLAAWIPILRQYGPSLLEECANAIELSEGLVRKWLRTFMFAGDPRAYQRAARVAEWIGNHNNFKAHGRQIGITDLQKRGVKVVDLRTDSALREAVWAVWSAYRVTFDTTGAYKIFENSRGEAFIRSIESRIVQIPAQLVPAQPPAPQPPPTRAERRRKGPAR
jgi:hypothetical protein